MLICSRKKAGIIILLMNFIKLEPSNYPEFKPYFNHQRYHLCPYSLGSIIAWSNNVYHPFGAIQNGAVIVYADFIGRPEKRHLILPISPEKEYTPDELADLSKELGIFTYWFVPEEYILRYGEERISEFFSIREQEGLHDYIYNKEDLAGLKGNKYSKKRNLIHQFMRNYIHNGNVKVEPITDSSVDECLEFLDVWCEENDCGKDPSEDDLACEKVAAQNTLKNMALFEAKGLQLRIDGNISAFGIASQLTDDMGVLQYEKAKSSIKGLYQYFDQQCAEILFNGKTYINKESDMGEPGLMHAKKSYHPIRQVKSYSLKLI